MKTKPSSTLPLRRQRSESGIVLVIVLGMLTLVAILVIAFLTSASTELTSAKSYAVGLNARALSDSAVNIVISQVQDATSTPTLAWASQPGMLRTYDNTGAPVTSYKLYSADTLRVTGTYSPLANVGTEVPPTWSASPNLYTDLNSPVTVAGIPHYPIVDPSAVATDQTGTLALSGTYTPIEGCYIDKTNLATGTSTTQTNPVPMPVKWLYILKDGSITTISATGTITSATNANYVVGRIAYWTDDESCKVNVNTASVGTFWDRPFAHSIGYAGYESAFLNDSIPVQNEFQRYPGHPATTSLSVIFPPVAGESTHDYNERMYGIIPRVVGGGSQSGTVITSTLTGTTTPPTPDSDRLFSSPDEFLFAAAATSPRNVNLKGPATNFTESDIARTRFFLTANSRSPEVNMFNKPRITLWPLQANTANVSAPASAPNRTAKEQLIAFCSTIGTKPYYFQRYNTFDPTKTRTVGQTYPAYLASLGITATTTVSSQSPYLDWTKIQRNQDLYTYLQNLTNTAIPGLGGKLSGSSGSYKYNANTRNQILTEMVDFIRSEIATASTGSSPTYFYAPGVISGQMITGERQVVPLEPPAGTPGAGTKGFGRFETIQEAALVFYRMNPPTSSYDTSTQLYTVTQQPLPDNVSTANPIKIGVVLILEPFNPTPGSRSWCENMRVQVTGLSGMKVNGLPLTLPPPGVAMADPATVLLTGIGDYINATALMGPEFFTRSNPIGGGPTYKSLGATTVNSPTEEQNYPFYGSFNLTAGVSKTGTVTTGTITTFTFLPPPSITINIYPGYATALNAADKVQTITMNFPTGNVNLPIPTVGYSVQAKTGTMTQDVLTINSTDYNARIGGTTGTVTYPRTGLDEDDGNNHQNTPFVQNGDTVRSVSARYMGPALGDLRVFAALKNVPQEYFNSYGAKSPSLNLDSPEADDYSATAGYDSSTTNLVHSLRMFAIQGTASTGGAFGLYNGSDGPLGKLINVGFYGQFHFGSTDSEKWSLYPLVPRGLTYNQVVLAGLTGPAPGDWDTGPGSQPDGPYINKPDESNSSSTSYKGGYTSGSVQYGGQISPEEQGITYSPNRQIASAVVFGSLPTGIDQTATLTPKPWQTLLFCPNPAAGIQHPGYGQRPAGTAVSAPPYIIPPDSAFLDFFTMPVVEPYAISEPFSSAGKINMNYQIAPFTYLTRDTGVRAVLKSTRLMAIPQTDSGHSRTDVCYKFGGLNPPNYRYTINPDEVSGTLAGFQVRFTSGDIFRSATEICNIFLVPQYRVDVDAATNAEVISSTVAAGNPTYASVSNPAPASSWWKDYLLTGDNLRESPYGNIYPRLTTKSNTYTVYVTAQTIKKATGTAANVFVDGKDQVTSEYRGSFIMQRYLDPNSDSLILANGTASDENNAASMVGPYKYRVIATKRFAP